MNESESNPKLPGVITAITPQKKNKERYTVFVDDAYLLGVDASTLLDFKLKKGQEVTTPLYRELQRAEGRQAVKSYMLKILSRRDHARRELFNKARRKDHPADVINDVLDELEAKDFINEASFAEKFARDKSHLNQWGPSKIKAHLAKKGINKDLNEQAVNLLLEELDMEERLTTLVKKRRRRFNREEDAFKRKKKVFDYLQRKGYYPESIYRHLDDLMNVLDQ